MIVHDLKNSIGSVELAIESIEENMEDKQYVGEMLTLVKESTRESFAFVMDILDYTSNKKMDKTIIEAKA